MNIRDLEYLVALSEYRHFGKAAEACHISQPSLSTQIKKLEDELGLQLIERQPRQVMITEAGEEILARARNVLSEVSAMKAYSRQSQDPFKRELKLGIIPTLAPYVLPSFIPKIHKAYPHLSLRLVEYQTPDLLEQIMQNQLDCLLLALPIEEPHLATKPVYEEAFYLAVPKKHRLAQRQQVTMADIDEEEVLLLEDGHCLRDQALEVCQAAGVRVSDEFKATSLETLRQMVALEQGITFIPKDAVHSNGNIVYVPFREPKPSRAIGFAWRKTAQLEEIIEGLSGLL